MAKFTKGNKHGRGRPKGVKNSRTEQWERFADFMMIKGLQKFEEELQGLKGKQYTDTVVSLMEFFQPKLTRTEQTTEIDNKIEIVIKNEYAEFKPTLQSDN